MSGYLGDFLRWPRVDFDVTFTDDTGLPTALTAGSACVRACHNPSVLANAGISTVTVSGGMAHVTVFTYSAQAFFATGGDYLCFVGNGTVDSVSVIGYPFGRFSIENRSALRATTTGMLLDVSAGGEAGVDWANVGSPTTTLGLSGTTVKTATDVETDTADIQTRLPAALVSGRMDSNMQAMAAGVVATTSFAAGAIDAAAIAANAITSSELAQSAAQEVADEVLNRDIQGGSSGSSRNVTSALRAIRNKTLITETGQLFVYEEDDAATAWVAVTSTGVVATTGILTGVDPA